jgi:hemoglobin-like flavoprotein
MTPERIARLEASFALLRPHAARLVANFYENLFARAPSVRGMFKADLSAQHAALAGALVTVAENLRTLDRVVPALRAMGARHALYGAQPEHYPIVRDVLVDAMASVLGPAWNAQLGDDWRAALDLVASVMIEGGRPS